MINMNTLEKLVALAKRRGFIYPGSEIYGGIAGFWDYGPLGVELKNNLKRLWWKTMVYARDDVLGIDASIVMNPQVWVASGHVNSFTDPLVECKICHVRFRADKKEEITGHNQTVHQGKGEWTEPKQFNILTEVFLGVTEPKMKAYLRGEITQGVFVNFQNVVSSTRMKIPFGIAQIGKAFRNEITPGNFTFRSREFEQMELEFFIKPDEKKGDEVFNYWKQERMNWYQSLGIRKDNLRFRDHEPDERAHYARKACDIEYNAPFSTKGGSASSGGWSEFEGIHHRGEWDLSRHKLQYKDQQTGEEFTPWVIETSGGVDRAVLFLLLDAYQEDEKRVVLRLDPRLAPYKAAIFPLVSNKPDLVTKARNIYHDLKRDLYIAWDDRGNIGKRYFAQDEIGTPFCVTIDYETLDSDTVTVRDRDTTVQERVPVTKLKQFFAEKIK